MRALNPRKKDWLVRNIVTMYIYVNYGGTGNLFLGQLVSNAARHCVCQDEVRCGCKGAGLWWEEDEPSCCLSLLSSSLPMDQWMKLASDLNFLNSHFPIKGNAFIGSLIENAQKPWN